jgi:putative ABC transport system permease protein
MARSEYLGELARDLGYAVRTLRRTSGFAAVAILTLGLGIGANSAIFSVVHGVLLQSLPFRDAEQLHVVSTLYPDGTEYSLSPPDFMSVREEVRALERVEAHYTRMLTLVGVGDPKEVRGTLVSDGLFEMLGVRLALGRSFALEEFQPGAGSVVVLDHGFWQREFGGDRSILGRRLIIGGDAYEVVGVLAPGERLPSHADIYDPLGYDETFSALTDTGRRGEYLSVIGRAAPGASTPQLNADLHRIGTQLQQTFPETNGALTFSSQPLRNVIIGDVRAPLLMLLGAVGFVLLVACANVANLLLARASARRGELAVRAALGAGRGRLLRQLMTESVVLGLAGGLLGLAIAWWGTRALVGAQPADIPRLEEVGVNGTVVLFTLGIALLTSIAFGIAPALQATGLRLTSALREGGRGAGGSGQRMRSGLVIVEMALAVVLLTGAGLLIRSFLELTRVDPGFQVERAMSFRVNLQGDEYADGQQIRDRITELHERIGALPGVAAVGAATTLPLSGLGSLWGFSVPDGPPPPPNVNQEMAVVSVTPDYFRAIGAPLLRGRALSAADHNDAPDVMLINEAGARRWFPGEDPVGRRVNMNGEREIVGVVADMLQRDPGQAAVPQAFVPHAQSTTRSIRIVVRTAGEPLALAPAIRAVVNELDSNLPITAFTPLRQTFESSVARPRFYTSLLTLFAAVALALAATGIFGVMSYAVAQRSREISIRMAVGARATDVLLLIVGRALLLAVAGIALGITAALMLGTVIRSQLYGVALLDPLTIGAVVLVLAGTAAVASYLPARRATTIEPGMALRS